MTSKKITRKEYIGALVGAVSNGQLSEANYLLSAGVDVNEMVDGETALHFAVGSRRSIPGIRWLIENGADLNARNRNGSTPLMIASAAGGSKGCRIAFELIEAGCDVLARRPDGLSALEFAAESGEPKLIRKLVHLGLPVDGLDECALFPALLAVRAGNLVNLKELIKLGCDLSRKTHLRWANGMTCLAMARFERKTKIVDYLERIGAPKS